MARIAGVDIPKNKKGKIALTYIYGIGVTTAEEILGKAGVDPIMKVDDWDQDAITSINRIIGDEYMVEGELRGEVTMNIKRLQDIGSYRGIRHRKGLPVHGQRTSTNARTRKGKKKTVAGKKKAPRK
jgi:small subunit ribosomal protein S13